MPFEVIDLVCVKTQNMFYNSRYRMNYRFNSILKLKFNYKPHNLKFMVIFRECLFILMIYLHESFIRYLIWKIA